MAYNSKNVVHPNEEDKVTPSLRNMTIQELLALRQELVTKMEQEDPSSSLTSSITKYRCQFAKFTNDDDLFISRRQAELIKDYQGLDSLPDDLQLDVNRRIMEGYELMEAKNDRSMEISKTLVDSTTNFLTQQKPPPSRSYQEAEKTLKLVDDELARRSRGQ